MKKSSVINKKFILAAQYYQVDELKNLLDQGADIHTNKDGALKRSAAAGHFETVKFLVARGAYIHAGDDVALRRAAENGHLEIVKFLLTRGANVHAYNDAALRQSAAKGHLEIVKFLVAKRANIHADDDGALRNSAYCGRLEIVKFLIAHGADIHANNDQALEDSDRRKHCDVWQVLSAFIKEEKLLVAAVGVTSASTWISATKVASVALVAADSNSSAGVPMLSAAHPPPPLTITKTQRTKIWGLKI